MGKYKPTGQPTGRPPKKLEVKKWLQEAVVEGHAKQALILISEANERGFSERIVNAVKKELGFYSIRKNRVWWWSVEADPVLPDFAEDPEGPQPPMSQQDIQNFAWSKFYSLTMSRESRKFSEVVGEVITEARQRGTTTSFTDTDIQQFTLAALEQFASDPETSEKLRAKLAAWVVKIKSTLQEPTFEEQVAKMSLSQIEDALDGLNEAEMSGTLSEQSQKNREILRSRFAQLCNEVKPGTNGF